jgi:hypothetical protein
VLRRKRHNPTTSAPDSAPGTSASADKAVVQEVGIRFHRSMRLSWREWLTMKVLDMGSEEVVGADDERIRV